MDTAADPISRKHITIQLHQNGYVMLPEWYREETTISIAHSLGTVVDIRALLPQTHISTVQTLTPNHKTNSSDNHYTGTYGLAEFPMHTDLAHWARPPRYFILRCQKGTPEVTTKILPGSALYSILKMPLLRRALARPRQLGQNGLLLLLPLVFQVGNIYGFRWDSLFLVPMNETATQVAEMLSMTSLYKSKLKSFSLARNGDTLIIDNWRCLHGRSKVPETEINRKIERVYLSEIHT